VTSPKEAAVAHKLKFEWSIPVKGKNEVKILLDGKTIAILTDVTLSQSMKLKQSEDGTFESGDINGSASGNIVKTELDRLKKKICE
jgi:hypothetical protein